MGTWRSTLPSLPILSLATAACVLFAVAAFILAASPRPVNAESGAASDTYAAFAVNPTDVVIAGTVVGVGDGLLGVQEVDGAAPVAFPLAQGAALSRDGRPVSLLQLRPGDRVQLTVNYAAGEAVVVAATAATGSWFQPTSGHAALAALGLIAATGLLILRERSAAKAVAPARMPRTGLSDLSQSLLGRRRNPEYTA